jgi:hypothetical protein
MFEELIKGKVELVQNDIFPSFRGFIGKKNGFEK